MTKYFIIVMIFISGLVAVVFLSDDKNLNVIANSVYLESRLTGSC